MDTSGTKTYHEGSTISISHYDGQGRRIKKEIRNSGDLDYTYVYYYDGQRVIEERNGSEQTIKTYVWGNQYIDELVQINTHAATGAAGSYWTMQDANYNVLGVVNATGRQVERYEYTPYGQRTVYGRMTVLSDTAEASTWGNDAMLMYPQLTSARLISTIPVTLCDFGWQGLPHCSITGNIGNRDRIYSPGLMRMMQNDRSEYIDGMNRYLSRRGNPINYVDWDGRQAAPTSQPESPPTSQPTSAPTQTLSFKTIQEPKGALCGNLPRDNGWIIQWILSKSSIKGGWIIQKMEVSMEVKHCGGGILPKNTSVYSLWEAWKVNAGKKITTFAERGDTKDDTFWFTGYGEDCSMGKIIATGTARFYEDLTLPGYFIQDSVPQSGILHATRKDPGELPGGTGAITHTMTVEWDCCSKDKYGNKDKKTKVTHN